MEEFKKDNDLTFAETIEDFKKITGVEDEKNKNNSH